MLLKCTKNLDGFFKRGNIYKVIAEYKDHHGDYVYEVSSDYKGTTSVFTRDPDEDGLCLSTWFILIGGDKNE
ncbi:hypothetical protein [Kurthia sp. Dielmo]|uniref:hypothetical protein n=1 Tax=Kurthia sp. Dielmo TaxID=1033738 RepID=UPI00111CECA1|nr:hypothetical protein [Kurthia sp. Dielmo]